MTGFNKESRKAYEKSGHVAAEAAENVRTVAMLARESAFIAQYGAELAGPDKASRRNAHVSGLALAITEMSGFLVMALTLYYGTNLIYEDPLRFDDMMKVFYAILFASMTIGQTAAMAGDWAKAVMAASEVFYVVDRVPLIDVTSALGTRPAAVEGGVNVDNVTFSYPQRASVQVLRGLSMVVPAGQTVALVGHSGCGKSTVTQLLLRYYDPATGVIRFDNTPLRDLHLATYRSHIGLVSQEPVLFAGTIRENVLYGLVRRVCSGGGRGEGRGNMRGAVKIDRPAPASHDFMVSHGRAPG